MQQQWVRRWNYWMSEKPKMPGVYKLKGDGYYIRARVKNKMTGDTAEISMPLRDVRRAQQAYAVLQSKKEEARAGGNANRPDFAQIKFSDYAISLLERKAKKGKHKSKGTQKRWEQAIRLHLAPAFGNYLMISLTASHFEDWLEGQGEKVKNGEYVPESVNGWLSILRVIVKAFVREHRLPANPLEYVEDLDTAEHDPYPAEDPNQLTQVEMLRFLTAMGTHFPQWFAMTCLGFMTGLRPSSMRPLRRKGDTADVKWHERELLIRRSQVVGNAVMNTTKTGNKQGLPLPSGLIALLSAHVESFCEPLQLQSELLFPSDRTGSFVSRSCLKKPFDECARIAKLGKRITPRGMRRTFNDLARTEKVREEIQMKISGHVSDKSRIQYSTIEKHEMLEALDRIFENGGLRQAWNDSGALMVKRAS